MALPLLPKGRYDVLVVRFLDPDGRRIHYRWKMRREDEGYDAFTNPQEALETLSWQFQEHVLTSPGSEPDADGVRWFGDDD